MKGVIRAYRYDSLVGRWVALGAPVVDGYVDSGFGISVSLSESGSEFAAGAWKHNGSSYWEGGVLVFRYSPLDDAWVQVGETIDGSMREDIFGYSVALSGDGKVTAGGARWNDVGGRSAGHVRVFGRENEG